jgi:hypothetical protein
MINEVWWSTDNINSDEWVRQDIGKITEQDVKRAQWDSAQAKKAQEEIKKNKSQNNDIAKFLAFLLKNIKNDNLISAIYNTFFKVIDPRTKITYLRKSVNDIVIIWFFAPFFPKEVEKFGLMIYFQDLLKNKSKNINLSEYMEYIKLLSQKYHDNIPINKDNLINLLSILVWEFGIYKEWLTDSGKEKIKKELDKKIR